MLRKLRTRGTKADRVTKSYRSDYLRRLTLQKAFKGTEKGYKPLERLSDTIHTGIEVLWRQQCMCDIELISADRKCFKAHRLLLATCCDYFYDLLALSDTDIGFQVEVDNVRGNILELLLEAMYTGRVKVEATNVDDILLAADNLGMYLVMDACEEFLLEHVGKENCLQILSTSSKYGMIRLTEQTLQVAARNFMHVSKTPNFRSLPVEHLISLLQRDDLHVHSELDTFHRAKLWIEENRSARVKHAADVMEAIRLPLLSPTEIVDNVERCLHSMDVHGCQKLVKEALHYHLMPSRQCLLQSPRTVPRKKGDLCLVVVGGAPRLTSEPVNDKVMKYNLTDNKWEQVTVLPEPRHHHAVAVLNGFLYVAGGDVAHQSRTPVNTVHRFDPRNCSWMQVASMLNCRQSFQLCVLNNVIYAVGGRVTDDELLSAVEKYDPSLDRWEEVASLSSPRRCVAIGCLSGKLYAVGGSNMKNISSRAERYSPMENKWELIRPTNTPRFFGHLQSIHSFLYLLGGAGIDNRGNIICVDTIERYSHSANQWTIIAYMRTPRSESGSTIIREKIYIVGGYNWNKSERINEVECFDTETNCWSVAPRLDKPLTGIAADSIHIYEDSTKQNDLTNNAEIFKTGKPENRCRPIRAKLLSKKQAHTDPLKIKLEKIQVQPHDLQLKMNKLQTRSYDQQIQSDKTQAKSNNAQNKLEKIPEKTQELQSKSDELHLKSYDQQTESKELQIKSQKLQTEPDELQAKSNNLQTKSDKTQAKSFELQTTDNIQTSATHIQTKSNDKQAELNDIQTKPDELQANVNALHITNKEQRILNDRHIVTKDTQAHVQNTQLPSNNIRTGFENEDEIPDINKISAPDKPIGSENNRLVPEVDIGASEAKHTAKDYSLTTVTEEDCVSDTSSIECFVLESLGHPDLSNNSVMHDVESNSYTVASLYSPSHGITKIHFTDCFEHVTALYGETEVKRTYSDTTITYYREPNAEIYLQDVEVMTSYKEKNECKNENKIRTGSLSEVVEEEFCTRV